MKSKISRTPEGIPSYFIVKVIHSILYPLTSLFNLSLKLNSIPFQWKNALVIPIFKKGNRSDTSNYRPISLTSSFSRLFESILMEKMMLHVQEHNLVSHLQFGFLPRRSSAGQLLFCLKDWFRSYCKSESTNILYTDITKAFDSVSHRILNKILHQFGFSDEIVVWIRNFLFDRKQQVCIGKSVSSPLEVISGVPQGSVIGPFLFVLFLNGITNCVSSDNVNIALFADDSKLYSTSPEDLQTTVNLITSWLKEHKLVLVHTNVLF